MVLEEKKKWYELKKKAINLLVLPNGDEKIRLANGEIYRYSCGKIYIIFK